MWLPSNLGAGRHSTGGFTQLITRGVTCSVSPLFIGPGAEETRVIDDTTSEGYGDVNNHWVLEMQEDDEDRPDLLPVPRVNFMRSLVPWNGDSQVFFNGLMRAFDLDICMMFVGLMPTDRDIRHVIVPQHLANRAIQRTGRGSQMAHQLQMNMLYWNQMRLETTAPARIQARLEKMYSKYNLQRLYTAEEFSVRNLIMPTESIEATPVSLYRFMNMIRRSPYCLPTPANTMTEEFRDRVAAAQPRVLMQGDSITATVDGLHPAPMPVAAQTQGLTPQLRQAFDDMIARAQHYNQLIVSGQMTMQEGATAYLTTGTGS